MYSLWHKRHHGHPCKSLKLWKGLRLVARSSIEFVYSTRHTNDFENKLPGFSRPPVKNKSNTRYNLQHWRVIVDFIWGCIYNLSNTRWRYGLLPRKPGSHTRKMQLGLEQNYFDCCLQSDLLENNVNNHASNVSNHALMQQFLITCSCGSNAKS